MATRIYTPQQMRNAILAIPYGVNPNALITQCSYVYADGAYATTNYAGTFRLVGSVLFEKEGDTLHFGAYESRYINGSYFYYYNYFTFSQNGSATMYVSNDATAWEYDSLPIGEPIPIEVSTISYELMINGNVIPISSTGNTPRRGYGVPNANLNVFSAAGTTAPCAISGKLYVYGDDAKEEIKTILYPAYSSIEEQAGFFNATTNTFLKSATDTPFEAGPEV